MIDTSTPLGVGSWSPSGCWRSAFAIGKVEIGIMVFAGLVALRRTVVAAGWKGRHKMDDYDRETGPPNDASVVCCDRVRAHVPKESPGARVYWGHHGCAGNHPVLPADPALMVPPCFRPRISSVTVAELISH